MSAGSVTVVVSPLRTVSVTLTTGVDDGGVVTRTWTGVELAVVMSNSTTLSLGGLAMNWMKYSLPPLVRPAESEVRCNQLKGDTASQLYLTFLY